MSNLFVEVDGVRHGPVEEYDDNYYSFGNMSFHGMDEVTSQGDHVRVFSPNTNQSIFLLNAWCMNDDGSTWGMIGAFNHGEWSATEDGKPLWRVWERIA